MADKGIPQRFTDLNTYIRDHYAERDQPGMQAKLVSACEEQIRIARPLIKRHNLRLIEGYDKLPQLYQAQGRHGDAIAVCEQAMKLQLPGSWPTRIERLTREGDKSSLGRGKVKRRRGAAVKIESGADAPGQARPSGVKVQRGGQKRGCLLGLFGR
jgi:hypothetical protein